MRPWTLSHFNRLSEYDRQRHELVDGVLVEMPPRSLRHEHALEKLFAQVCEQLPDGFWPDQSFDVLLKRGQRPLMRKPDIMVADPKKPPPCYVPRFAASDVVLVVEIVQEESEDLDLRVKPLEYAAAKIPNYWVVSLDGPVSMIAYSLVGGRYEQVAGGTGTVDVTSPVPMSLNLGALMRLRVVSGDHTGE